MIGFTSNWVPLPADWKCGGAREPSICVRRISAGRLRCSSDDGFELQPRIERRAQPDPKTSAKKNISDEPGWLDDLTSRRMGSGSIFYGKREDDEDVVAGSGKDDVFEDPRGELLDYRMTPVVVIGASDRDVLGQLIALGLTNINFNVRVLTSSLARAEDIYGPDGANLDILVGNVSDAEWLAEAMRGGVAIVWSRGEGESGIGGFAAPWTGKGSRAEELKAALSAASKTRSVRRFIGVANSAEEADLVTSFPGKHVAICPPTPKKRSLFGGESSSLLDRNKEQRGIVIKSTRATETGSVTRLDLSQLCIDVLQTDAFCGVFGPGVQKEVFIPDDVKELAATKGVEAVDLNPLASRKIYVSGGSELSSPLAAPARRKALKNALLGEE